MNNLDNQDFWAGRIIWVLVCIGMIVFSVLYGNI